jgi:hypothetical protein
MNGVSNAKMVPCQEQQQGAISHGVSTIFNDLTDLRRILNDIEDLVFIPRPVSPSAETSAPVNEIVTVINELGRVHNRIQDLITKSHEIREAIGSQLDSKTRLV